MSEREAAGMRRLMRDLDEADWPAPELLARYASEPNALSEADKRQVERALARSKQVADELATLRGFDFSRLDADRTAEATSARAVPAAVAWLSARIWAHPPVWIALGAAALGLAYGLTRVERDRTPTRSPSPAPALAEALPPKSPSGPEAAPMPAATANEQALAQAQVPEPSPSSPEASPSPEAPRVAHADPNESPLREHEPEIEPTGKPAAEPETARRDEILLAMAMPDYQPAYGIEIQSAGDWIVRGGGQAEPRITLLTPDHVARSCSATPILHWSVDRLPTTGEFFLTIVDANDEPIVLDRALPRSTPTRLRRVDLSALGIELPADRVLRWSIALRDDDASAPRAFDFGWLRVETPEARIAQELPSRADATRAAGYAELGCYSEALEAALSARRAHPDSADAERAVARLAEQAGLTRDLLRD